MGLPVYIALSVIVAIKESNVADSWYLLLLQAVCCSDKEHCCPEGYTCDVSAGTCNKGLHSMSWNAVAVRDVDRVFSSNVVCPGGQQECDVGQTCCELDSGSYSCCPYDKVLHISHSLLMNHVQLVNILLSYNEVDHLMFVTVAATVDSCVVIV